MKSLISSWKGQSVVVSYDHPTETWMFIAIHDTTLGAAMGGCRMMAYDRPEDGLRDAMRLAEGMTYKWATIGFDLGGGKSVLAISRQLEGAEREGLFERFGSLIDSLRGAYACGADLGTTPHDMGVIGRSTKYVHGVNQEQGSLIDPGPYTALGVLSGMKAALRQVFGSDALTGRSILIQGAGDVGYPLGETVAEAGGKVIVTDMDEVKARALADATGGSVVPPSDCYTTVVCDPGSGRTPVVPGGRPEDAVQCRGGYPHERLRNLHHGARLGVSVLTESWRALAVWVHAGVLTGGKAVEFGKRTICRVEESAELSTMLAGAEKAARLIWELSPNRSSLGRTRTRPYRCLASSWHFCQAMISLNGGIPGR